MKISSTIRLGERDEEGYPPPTQKNGDELNLIHVVFTTMTVNQVDVASKCIVSDFIFLV